MKEKKQPRMPDLDLDAEAASNLERLLSRPSHPSAAEDNLARAKQKLRESHAARRTAAAH